MLTAPTYDASLKKLHALSSCAESVCRDFEIYRGYTAGNRVSLYAGKVPFVPYLVRFNLSVHY